MQQHDLPFGDYKTPWERLLRVLDDAVCHLGHKEVVYKLNVAKSTVSSALKPRDEDEKPGKEDRHWRQEWTLIVLEMLADRYTDTANQYIKAILEAQAVVTRRFEIVALDDEPTAEELAVFERVNEKLRRRKKKAA